MSLPEISASASKRQRVDKPDDDSATTSSRPSIVLARRPILSPTSSRSTSKRSRSSSPVKTTAALGNLRKPVRFPALAENATPSLPVDVRKLYKCIKNITFHHEAYMPLSVRDDIDRAANCRHRMSSFFDDSIHPTPDLPGQSPLQLLVGGDEPVSSRQSAPINATGQTGEGDIDGDDDSLPPGPSYAQQRRNRQPNHRDAALAELDTLVDLIAAANECRVLGRHESTWNLQVHYPLFQLAFRPAESAHVLVEPVTHAAIAPSFLPPWNTPQEGFDTLSETVDSKKLDFVLALFVDPAPSSPEEGWWPGRHAEADRLLAAAIRDAVSVMSIAIGVNHFSYPPLRLSPIAAMVETKTGNGSNFEEGRRQLGVCVAAWHQRITTLMASRPWMKDQRIVTLPLLLILEHEWRLSFAVDTGQTIDIYTDMLIGNTSTVSGIYTIVAVLRTIAAWIRGPFSDWMRLLFLGAEPAHTAP